MAYAKPRGRPIGVVILAILVILGGALLTILALIGVLGSSLGLAVGLPDAPLLIAGSFIFLILSLILLAAGLGLYNLRPWAWWLAVLVLALLLVNNVLGWLGGTPDPRILFTILIPGLIFVYLLAVRGHFRSYVVVPR